MEYIRHLFNPILLFGALGTMAILSLVFKENRFYRVFEHVFLGLALGYDLEFTWTTILRPLFWDAMVRDGQWAWVMTVPVGLMFYGIYTQRFVWMSRVIFGIFFGLAAGAVFQDFAARVVPQVTKSFLPSKSLIPPPPIPGDPHALLHQISFVLNNFLFLGIVVSVLVYFLFAFEQKNKAVLRTAQIGRWALMFAFGAIFGSTIMTRMALLIDRMYFIFHDWLRVVKG